VVALIDVAGPVVVVVGWAVSEADDRTGALEGVLLADVLEVVGLDGGLEAEMSGARIVNGCDELTGAVLLAPDVPFGSPPAPEQPAASSTVSSTAATVRTLMTTSPPHPAAESVRPGTVTPSGAS